MTGAGAVTHPAGDLIPLETAARLLMISVERVRQLIKDGYIPRQSPGKTTLVGAVQGYIRFRDDADRRATKSASANRVSDARAAEIELRLAERRRGLIPREEAEAAFVVGLVNEELNGLPARLTRDVATWRKYETEVDGSKARIEKALADADEQPQDGETSPPHRHGGRTLIGLRPRARFELGPTTTSLQGKINLRDRH